MLAATLLTARFVHLVDSRSRDSPKHDESNQYQPNSIHGESYFAHRKEKEFEKIKRQVMGCCLTIGCLCRVPMCDIDGAHVVSTSSLLFSNR